MSCVKIADLGKVLRWCGFRLLAALVILLVVLTASTARAEYTGGSGDGFSIVEGTSLSIIGPTGEPPVPELSTIVLMGIGLALLGGYLLVRRRKVVATAAMLLLLTAGALVPFSQSLEEASASNVALSGIALAGTNGAADYTHIQFDLSWEYSWKDATNYDAVWVFAKYKVDGGDGNWHHATLATSGHIINTATPAEMANNTSAIHNPSDNATKGVFIHRTANGTGTVTLTDANIRWDYGADGLADDATVDVKVLAIEMVYIPGGVNFDIGDGNGSSESTYAFHTGAGDSKVTIGTTLVGDIHVDTNNWDDDVIETGTGIGIDGDGGLDTDNSGSVDNTNFPIGYNAFYVMKYEISQRQYAEFLNTLTSTQATTRYPGQTGYRHYIEVQGGVYGCDANGNDTLNESNDGEWVACNLLSWMDGAAYADWAGLRPMTELEFEKACRGPTAAVYGEYAWGSTSITQATGISNPAEAGEVSSSAANAVYNSGVQGPLRNGALTDSDDSRVEAGASYYGVMEMSGNLWERSVTVGNPTGRGFAGSHGDGSLSTAGNATNSDWPGYVTSEVTGATGSGSRGGVWSGSLGLSVSSRNIAAYGPTIRSYYYGFRAVRTS